METKNINVKPYETYILKEGRVLRTYWLKNIGSGSEDAYHYVNDERIDLITKNRLIEKE